jgi:para-aminobenzoate synthetase component I
LKRKFTPYPIANLAILKIQMLDFLQKFSIFCFLDNHHYEFDKSVECLAGAGVNRSIVSSTMIGLKELEMFTKENVDWIFGHLSYDVKNEVEELQSSNYDGIQFPDFHFFIPEIVFILSESELKIGVYQGHDTRRIYDEIISSPIEFLNSETVSLKARFTKESYIETIKNLQAHILKGDCYEINFCHEFYADEILINPLRLYNQLSALSPNPFSAFYKYEDKYALCASPERYLKKINSTIISQPMKGTTKRIPDNALHDEAQKNLLSSSEKERAENIMIVDMVRNDLSKICIEGSVKVKELLSIYSFPQVHQMISTITGILQKDLSVVEIFKATFPMGSMTGAPKKKVMELIELYEKTKRGLFSGSIGYINPQNDFDFNVVIRSIFYNQSRKYLSMQAGSAITFKSDPEKEYEECLLKINVLKKSIE